MGGSGGWVGWGVGHADGGRGVAEDNNSMTHELTCISDCSQPISLMKYINIQLRRTFRLNVSVD